MSVLEALQAAAETIKSGKAESEAQIKQWIILPILRALGWDNASPEVIPEFAVDNGKVDYALWARKKAMVFIEAKRPGATDTNAERQLFGYASNQGVPFLILTDGDVWDFYLSMAEGVPANRRFYRAELHREENLPTYAKIFGELLQKKAFDSNLARKRAEKMHEDNYNRAQTLPAIPGIWRDLLQAPDDILRDLLAEAVERKLGTKPDLDDVEEFLQNFADVELPTPHPPSNNKTKIVGFVFKKQSYRLGAANRTLAGILKEFQRNDPEFITRFAPRVRGRIRPLVDKTPDVHLAGFSFELENGWWMMSNLSTKNVREKTAIACEVAGVKFGSELKFIEQ